MRVTAGTGCPESVARDGTSTEQELERVEATDAAAIVVDLSGLTFMDSTGVRLLVNAGSRSRAAARRLRLQRGPVAVQRVLELSGVATLLPFAG